MSKQEPNLKETAEFAKQIYGDEVTPTETRVYVHCWSTAKLAEQIGQKLFSDVRSDLLPQDAQEIVAAIVHAAFLHEAINVGRIPFEVVADVANVQVAAMVSTLSRDYRLVETKRDIEYRGRLSLSPVATQIVAVAAIVCTAQEIVNLLKTHGLVSVAKIRKILAQLDADLLVIHTAARYYTLRLYVHAARNLINDANQIIKRLKAENRAAKNMEKLAAAVELKMAAKQGVPTEDQPQKEKRRGKQRSARRNNA